MPHGKTRVVYNQVNYEYACMTCGKVYNSEYSRDLHNRYVHRGKKEEKKYVVCADCNKPLPMGREGHSGYCKCR